MKQHIFRQHGRRIKTVFPAVLALSLNHIPATSLADPEPATTDLSPSPALIYDQFRTELDFLIGKETWRDPTESGREGIVIKNMGAIKDFLDARVEKFNASQQKIKLHGFEWKQDRDTSDPMNEYWLFGYRIGSDKPDATRISLLTHMDTVAPGEPTDWETKEPFVVHEIDKEYNDEPTTKFLVARGSIDDKGPGVVVLSVLRAVAKRYDNEGFPEGLAFEVLFDTSEETDMATPHYLNDTSDKEYRKPTMGIVYDASWCVRAEKGIEGPAFTLPRQADPVSGLWIYTLDSEAGPSNQIPATATAVIRAQSTKLAKLFKATVRTKYMKYKFDDPNYRRAALEQVNISGTSVTLVTRGSGAQHGSAPQENRANGSNPLVSLVNFLAYLVYEEKHYLKFEPNSVSRMAQFMKWGWGTKVFGEYHPDLLQRDDWVFEGAEGDEGNGTTWALTKLVTSENSITLDIDVRYAIGHHKTGYTGSEGLLEGQSYFGEIIPQLVNRFHEKNPGEAITMTTAFRYAPDIRAISNPNYIKLNNAYKDIIGSDCPRLAIGGGTDAKGNNELIAAGALFTDNLGPPINYHGIDEGAPFTDLEKGFSILYQLMVNEINEVKAKSIKMPK